VLGFVGRIATAYPDKLIFCTDITTGDFRGTIKDRAFRAVVRQEVASLNLSIVAYCSGRSLLASPTGLTTDEAHLSTSGVAEIATNFYLHMRENGVTEG
jgi:hypothetical protein